MRPARFTLTLALLATMAVGACAGPIVWDKPGATAQDYNRESYDCLRDAKALGGAAYVGFGVTQRTTDWNLFGRCMMARGWTARRG